MSLPVEFLKLQESLESEFAEVWLGSCVSIGPPFGPLVSIRCGASPCSFATRSEIRMSVSATRGSPWLELQPYAYSELVPLGEIGYSQPSVRSGNSLSRTTRAIDAFQDTLP
jgi:hypothetical protein